ncbi:hypothetical protein [Parerythrobacter jejuensis]|nr:hypothetical protein [Parerythrobacter jejuensis]
MALTLLLLVAPAANEPVERAAARSSWPAPVAIGQARVEIVKGEAVVFERIEEKRSLRTTIRKDARGTTWVEFS